MRNRMQDLDFEQTVAFDSVKDFEFTRKAAQKFRQVVSLDSFEDEDADVIFHYLQGDRCGILQGNLHTEIHVTYISQAEFSGE